ncbi:hypothetical protein NKH72_28245 [Mesorhizobium sp. M0955]|uniref:hypothetical protein n=1 Tax=Mesorhizobium sp. M0955 TaxID=2957033 RepID=UPI00333B0183
MEIAAWCGAPAFKPVKGHHSTRFCVAIIGATSRVASNDVHDLDVKGCVSLLVGDLE